MEMNNCIGEKLSIAIPASYFMSSISIKHQAEGGCQDWRGRTKWQQNYNLEGTADIKPGNHQ